MVTIKSIAFNVADIAAAWKVSQATVLKVGKDGRAAFFWLAAHLAYSWKFTLTNNLLIAPNGDRFGVRMLTRVVNFSRSGDHGMGRSLDAAGWVSFIQSLETHIVCDITGWPKVTLYYLDPSLILKWWKAKHLKVPETVGIDPSGKPVKEIVTLSRKRFIKLVEEENNPT